MSLVAATAVKCVRRDTATVVRGAGDVHDQAEHVNAASARRAAQSVPEGFDGREIQPTRSRPITRAHHVDPVDEHGRRRIVAHSFDHRGRRVEPRHGRGEGGADPIEVRATRYRAQFDDHPAIVNPVAGSRVKPSTRQDLLAAAVPGAVGTGMWRATHSALRGGTGCAVVNDYSADRRGGDVGRQRMVVNAGL